MSHPIPARSLKAGDEIVCVGVVEEVLVSFPQMRVEFTSGRISYYMMEDKIYVERGKKDG